MNVGINRKGGKSMNETELIREERMKKVEKAVRALSKRGSRRHLITCLFSLVFVLFLAGAVYPESDDALFIDENGNVGIGTTEPSEKLEVNGNLKVTGTGSLQHLKFLECGGRYRCTPKDCLAKCIGLGMRMATYTEVYAWASGGNDHCAWMWMLHSVQGLVRAFPMYHNYTVPGQCGRVGTGDIPRMEGFAKAKGSWNSNEKYNCACSSLK
jgi:hypothetical protein